jgi:hypothetical protein
MQQQLNQHQISQFIHDGYVKVDNAFPPELADDARKILWKDTGCNPNDPSTWTRPVVRLGYYDQEPFQKAVNTPLLHTAFDQLVGKGNWLRRNNLGTFPIRFPSDLDPGDTGWHVDSSFPGKDPNDFSTWRINFKSKGRALLMLFLFSDIEKDDAPTRIRVGSHLDVASILQPAGDEGMDFMELAKKLDTTAYRNEMSATGKAGTVYLCHPLLAHAAQAHHGKTPRFLAQPPLGAAKEFDPYKSDGEYSPVEIAIREGSVK